MQTTAADYPAHFTFDGPERIANWRPLVHWLLAIPHLVVLWALNIVQNVLLLVSFFTVLFTRAIPRGIFDVIVMIYRYQMRLGTYVLFMRESYPPFEFTPAAEDPGTDPARVTVVYPETLQRFAPLYKWLLAIPHVLVLVVLGIGAAFAALAAFFVVLFTGRYPLGIRNYILGVMRWQLRVQAYACLLRDEYPPFSLD